MFQDTQQNVSFMYIVYDNLYIVPRQFSGAPGV